MLYYVPNVKFGVLNPHSSRWYQTCDYATYEAIIACRLYNESKIRKGPNISCGRKFPSFGS